jgi:hypothetical protein
VDAAVSTICPVRLVRKAINTVYLEENAVYSLAITDSSKFTPVN